MIGQPLGEPAASDSHAPYPWQESLDSLEISDAKEEGEEGGQESVLLAE